MRVEAAQTTAQRMKEHIPVEQSTRQFLVPQAVKTARAETWGTLLCGAACVVRCGMVPLCMHETAPGIGSWVGLHSMPDVVTTPLHRTHAGSLKGAGGVGARGTGGYGHRSEEKSEWADTLAWGGQQWCRGHERPGDLRSDARMT